MNNLRQFLRELRKNGEVVDVHHEVDPYLEVAEIHRRVAAENGPALFFRNVKNSSFPVVTNLFGSPQRIEIAFGKEPETFIEDAALLLKEEFPPKLSTVWRRRALLKKLLRLGTKKRGRAPVMERQIEPVDLERLPLLKSWPLDGGSFITLPLVYTEPPGGGPSNLGMYRVQRYDKTTAGLHFQIGKGGGFHFHEAEKRNRPLPVAIFLGGPPALILSAIAPLPENVAELVICGLLLGKKLNITPSHPYPLISECEFALVGEARPHVRHPEGPFGDHYGYYSLKHDFPLFECNKIYHRKDAIYPATIVGKPRQEDYYIGNYLQKLLSPLLPLVMPGVKTLWSYGESGFHSLAAAVVKERYHRECMASAFRILGEGQLTFTKFLLVTDQNVDPSNIKDVLPAILERWSPESDLFVFSNLSLDTLDYTGPELNKGSRGVMLGIGEKVRELPAAFESPLPAPLRKCAPFCPGCLVVEGSSMEQLDRLLAHPSFERWPLLILVDNLEKTLSNFLWTVFTRFEPAADIYAKKTEIRRHHLCYSGPLLIDARMKPSYPPEVVCDEETAHKVTQNWDHFYGTWVE